MKIEQIICISDLHCGSKYGLCPPQEVLDEEVNSEETEISPLDIQKRKWNEHWLPFWDRMDELTSEPVVHINGDAVDGNWSRLSPHQLTCQAEEQINIAEACLKPIREKYKMTAVRGTPSHTGAASEWEESLFRRLKSVRKNGMYTQWAMRIEMANGALIDFKHHGPVSMPKMKTSLSIDSAWQNCVLESVEAGDKPPNLCIRSHGHTFKQSGSGTHLSLERALMTPAWQLMTPYGYKVASGRDSNINIGGVLLTIENGRVRVVPEFWRIPNSKVISI